jgi:hypothetical protein
VIRIVKVILYLIIIFKRVFNLILLLLLLVDIFTNQQRRESAVSIIAEQLVTEANIEVHTPINT